MPDITMCCNVDCKKRSRCFRFRAIPDEYQSYTNFKKYCTEDNYEMFMPIRTKHIEDFETSLKSMETLYNKMK